ncbi:hypothetical protein ACIRPT_02560 [Streptomyces sp. NPDC101227]|uniref:hypothetical protein n=1 Tax=Streptomyces sp. NPDC101227 TaxID=3366136 RepID=UPI00380FA115
MAETSAKGNYEYLEGVSDGVRRVSDTLGKYLRTAQVSDKTKVAKLEWAITKVEKAEGTDVAAETFIESIGKGLQSPGEFVKDNASGPISDDAADIRPSSSGGWRPKL